MDFKTQHLFEIENAGDTVIATPAANLGEFEYKHIEAGTRCIREALRQSGGRNVIVDLQKTEYCGSAGLGALIALRNDVRRGHGELLLCGLSPRENEILAITELGRLLPTFVSLSDALHALRGRLG